MNKNAYKPRIVDLPKVADPRGNLSFVQQGKGVPFDIERCYWIYDVPGGEKRYGRALKTTWEMIIALSGSMDVIVDGERYHLSRSYKGLLIPPKHWREIDNFSTNAVAVVLASTVYDEEDYIRDLESYREI